MKNKTVREWIKAFNEGKFDIKDTEVQVEAGWYDWFCSDTALMNRLKKMGNIIKYIKNDFILDNYYVWFKNNCPCGSPLYDDFRFEPLEENKRKYLYFGVQCDHPFGSDCRYEIFTARNDYKTEFKCNSKKEVLNFIDKIGQELQIIEITKEERRKIMYKRLNNTITNTIEKVMDNSVCDFTNWWKDDFETEVYFETEEDFKDLSDTELEIAKYDWIAWCLDGFVSEVCNLLGIEVDNTHSKYNKIILEEIHDIVKDMLYDKISV